MNVEDALAILAAFDGPTKLIDDQAALKKRAVEHARAVVNSAAQAALESFRVMVREDEHR